MHDFIVVLQLWPGWRKTELGDDFNLDIFQIYLRVILLHFPDPLWYVE